MLYCTRKVFQGKTCAVREELGYLWENFHGSMPNTHIGNQQSH